MPFGGNCEYPNHAACIAAHQDADDPDAYCAELRRRTEEHCKEAEEKHMTPNINKAVVPYSGTPIAPRERAWNASAAIKRARSWAGGPDKENISWPKYRRMFVRYDSDNVEDFGAYGGPHHDIIDDNPHTVFRGVAALAVVMSGGRGGMMIPEGEMAGCKAHVEKHYAQFDEKAPWERDEKDFVWLPEEKRAAKALHIDLAPDGAGVAKDGDPCDDGSTVMPEHILIIRTDADVPEEIELPVEGILDDNVAALSFDDGETWLEVQDGIILDDATSIAGDGDDDGDTGDGDADDAGDAGDDETGDDDTDNGDDHTGDDDTDNGDVNDAGDADDDTDDTGDEGDKDATPDVILDYSLLGELAETGYMRYLWNLTYALCDVLCSLIAADDLSVDERNAKATKTLGEFTALAQSSFAEAVALVSDSDKPENENPFAGMSFVDVVRNALAEGTSLDPDAVSSEDVNEIATQVDALQARLTEVTTAGQDRLNEARQLIDELLDMPLERKIDGTSDDDVVADLNEKYPWLEPSVRRKLAQVRGR